MKSMIRYECFRYVDMECVTHRTGIKNLETNVQTAMTDLSKFIHRCGSFFSMGAVKTMVMQHHVRMVFERNIKFKLRSFQPIWLFLTFLKLKKLINRYCWANTEKFRPSHSNKAQRRDNFCVSKILQFVLAD